MNLRSVTSRRPFRIVLFTGFVLFLLQHFQLVPWGGRSYDTWSWTACPGLSPFSVLCTASRSSIAHDVQVVVKTGGSEQQSRLKFLLKTILKEVPKQNVIIFSDLAEVVDDFQVYDIYTDVSKTERNSYEDFKLYDQQQVYKAEGKDTRTLEGGWALDKYKNLPMKRRLWQMQQDGRMSKRKWFLFIDTDTWIEWDNLFAFLEHLNPSKELYMGSPVWQDTIFAHGGSGYVLSYAALEALNTRKQEEFGSPFFSQYGVDVPNLCCGDWALAQALKDRGIHIKGYWPMFNGEIAATMSYDSEHWCEPVISLHHIGEESLEQFWQWVAAWRMRTANKRPFLFKDLFEYVAPDFSSIREGWVNTQTGSDYLEGNYTSFASCKSQCDNRPACLQYMFVGNKCALKNSIRLGRVYESNDDMPDRPTSGYIMDRIHKYASEAQCKSAKWVRSNP